jgi:hypothetical protein
MRRVIARALITRSRESKAGLKWTNKIKMRNRAGMRVQHQQRGLQEISALVRNGLTRFNSTEAIAANR